ncbi:MAG: phosphopantothenate/pantothenate synthetase [Candidatus Altiarchaeota archaeon]
MNVPDSHPRKASLDIRHRLTEAYQMGLVADAGLIAHGRGEAFDYLLGERTVHEAEAAEKAAAAMLLIAENPVVSVNGNTAALVAGDTVALAGLTGAEIEVNLFYRTVEREKRIADELRNAGAKRVYGLTKKHGIDGLSSERANVDDPLWNADVVLLALEDGDRTEALRNTGKKIIAIDLNPLSRTALKADITIVDNIVRAFPAMVEHALQFKRRPRKELEAIVDAFDNKKCLEAVVKKIRGSL